MAASLAHSPADAVAFTRADFAAIAALAHSHAGIMLSENKATLVHSRLGVRVRARGLNAFADYIALINRDRDERATAIEALTTNHTKFFREAHHFDHFAQSVRPHLLARLADGQRVRLWSAGSSSGEEAYSLMMTLLGDDRAAARTVLSGDVVMLASDLSRAVLEVGRKGLYPAVAAEDIPPPLLARWARLGEDGLRIDDALRRLVRFRLLNLLHPWPMTGRFDVIFCRNTMIYFDGPTKARLVERLADQLAPGGYLYIGHSERLPAAVAGRFRTLGQTIYQRRGP